MRRSNFLTSAATATMAMLALSCAKEQVQPPGTNVSGVAKEYWTGPEFTSAYKSSGEAIYSLRNVQKGLDELAAAGQTRAEVNLQPTHHYVRFLPQNEADITTLHDELNLDIFHFPFDHELTLEELDMHLDTKINGYAWQYCLVTPDFPMPNIKWELLDYVYLQPDDEGDITRSGKSYQLPADVYSQAIGKSEEITGKSTPETRAGVWHPSGIVKYISGFSTEPNPVPLKGAYVRVNTDFNTGEAYTGTDGRFWINSGLGGKFRNKAHHMIIWYRQEGQHQWKIHDKLGKADTKRSGDSWFKGEWNPIFGDGLGERDDTEFGFCAAIHRALYEFFYESHTGMSFPKVNDIGIRAYWAESGTTGYKVSDNTNRIHIAATGGEQGTFNAFKDAIRLLGHHSCVQYLAGGFYEEKPYIAWSIGVEHAYMRRFHPSYKRESYTTTSPAIIASLWEKGLSLQDIADLIKKNMPHTLEECRPLVKSLKRIDDTLVDYIFNNPDKLVL